MNNTSFGVTAIGKPTPVWAKWVFRVTFIVTTAIAFWVASTGLFKVEVKNEILILLKTIDMLVFGFSKLFGVEVKTDNDEK